MNNQFNNRSYNQYYTKYLLHFYKSNFIPKILMQHIFITVKTNQEVLENRA